MENKQTRQYYRLRYPQEERPLVDALNHRFPVSEISEKGLRLLFSHQVEVIKWMEFKGVVVFFNGKSFEVTGKVMRLDGRELVIQLSQGIDFKFIALEQIRIRKKFPVFFDFVYSLNESNRQTE